MGATIDIAERETAGGRFTQVGAVIEQYDFVARLKAGRELGCDGEVARIVADSRLVGRAGDAHVRVFNGGGFA